MSIVWTESPQGITCRYFESLSTTTQALTLPLAVRGKPETSSMVMIWKRLKGAGKGCGVP